MRSRTKAYKRHYLQVCRVLRVEPVVFSPTFAPMALYGRKEFCDLLDITDGNFTVYLGRGKLVATENNGIKYIDDSNPINRDWIGKRKVFLQTKRSKPNSGAKNSKASKPNIRDGKSKKTVALDLDSEDEDESGDYDGGVFDGVNPSLLSDVRIKADIKRIETVTKLNELKIEKQLGELLPTELIAPVITVLATSIISAFRSYGDNMITEICHKFKVSTVEEAKIRTELIKVINDAQKDAVSDAKKSTKRIVEDFAEKKTIGRQ